MKIDEVLILTLMVIMSVVATAAVRGADYDAALSAANKRDYVAAAQEFQRLADAGDARGENGLGVLHANGLGKAGPADPQGMNRHIPFIQSRQKLASQARGHQQTHQDQNSRKGDHGGPIVEGKTQQGGIDISRSPKQ